MTGPLGRSATADSSCGEFAQFELVGHSLETCSESFNLLLLLRGSRLGALTLPTRKLAE